MPARHVEGERRERQQAVVEPERQVDVRDRQVLRPDRADRIMKVGIEIPERLHPERCIRQQARRAVDLLDDRALAPVRRPHRGL